MGCDLEKKCIPEKLFSGTGSEPTMYTPQAPPYSPSIFFKFRKTRSVEDEGVVKFKLKVGKWNQSPAVNLSKVGEKIKILMSNLGVSGKKYINFPPI